MFSELLGVEEVKFKYKVNAEDNSSSKEDSNVVAVVPLGEVVRPSEESKECGEVQLDQWHAAVDEAAGDVAEERAKHHPAERNSTSS